MRSWPISCHGGSNTRLVIVLLLNLIFTLLSATGDARKNTSMSRSLHPFIVPVRALKEQLKLLQTSFQFLPDLIQHNLVHLG